MRQVVAPFEGGYLTCPEMALLLRAAKLKLDAVYGSFSRDPLTMKSKHMIFVARPLPAPVQPPAPPAQQPALVGAGAASTASLPAVPTASAAQPAGTNASATGSTAFALPAPGPAGGDPGAAGTADTSQAQGLQPSSSSSQGRRQTSARRNTRGQDKPTAPGTSQ